MRTCQILRSHIRKEKSEKSYIDSRKATLFPQKWVASILFALAKICPGTGWFLDFFFCFAGGKFGFLDVDFLGLGADPYSDP